MPPCHYYVYLLLLTALLDVAAVFAAIIYAFAAIFTLSITLSCRQLMI